MNLPNKLTISRIIIAPLFYIIFALPEWTGKFQVLSGIVMIILFAVMELSDLLDGIIARKQNLVTDIGKILDPFADVISRVTYFVCFTSAGMMPVWMLLVILYRELGITFVRMYLIKHGYSMAASMWGKLKAVFYSVSGIAGIFFIAADRLKLLGSIYGPFLLVCRIIFVISVISAVLSFAAYMVQIKNRK